MEQQTETGVSTQKKRELITEKQIDFSKKVTNILTEVSEINESMNPYERTFIQATAFQKLTEMMTKEVMIPIMFLQGNGIGFRTDRDKESPKGYDEDTVRRCFIEATMNGFSMMGNQVNILAGRPYYTKEGFFAKLRSIKDLTFQPFNHNLPAEDEKGKVSVTSVIEWEYKGVKGKQTLVNPVKKNAGMEGDGLWGKADRKCAKWLYTKITGIELGDGDVVDGGYAVEVDSHGNDVVNGSSNSKPVGEYIDPDGNTPDVSATPEQQAAFDKFISNKEKYKDLEGLKGRAKVWCEKYKLSPTQLNLDVFDALKQELIDALPK